ncbi:MAG: putative toxin-antitoxin system toxin component, PIN family [Candidatus Kapaibacterium sp.]|nr:MAG: putative toxin-antitoxin system toxin component, PIN family [Candidatus Kapabacteria bacterium]
MGIFIAKVVVLDPNIWISLAWKNNFSLLADILEHGFTLASSDIASQELERVLKRKKFAKKLSPEIIQEAINLHQDFCQFFHPNALFTLSPDLKDNYLFDICRESRAQYLVTGDRALLAMKVVHFSGSHSTSVISFTRLREILAEKTM